MRYQDAKGGVWHIVYDTSPIPSPHCERNAWAFFHDDYDGAEDGNDRRCGTAASILDCIDEINAIVEEMQ